MSTNYPLLHLPILPPMLEPILGDIRIPDRMTRKHKLKPGMALRDLIDLTGSDFSPPALRDLADFITYATEANGYLINDYAFPISQSHLLFDDLAKDISVRSTNALIRHGIRGPDDTSKYTVADIASVKGLGTKGLLEILCATSLHYAEYKSQTVSIRGEKLVISRNLKRVAESLSRKRWASKIHRNDLRLGSYIINADLYDTGSPSNGETVKVIAQKLMAKPLLPAVARKKRREVNKLIRKANELNKLKLKTEVNQIIDLLEYSPRIREIIKLRWGAGGDDPQTLEIVGQHASITRERVRQIEARTISKLSQKLPIWTPALDRAINLIIDSAPILGKDYRKKMLEAGIVRGDFSISSILNLAEIFGKKIEIYYDFDRDLLSSQTFNELIPIVNAEAISLVRHWGAITLEQLKLELAKSDVKISESQIRDILQYRKDFVWLDHKIGWFWLRKVKKNRIVNYIEKIMSVAGSIELSDLRNGTGRWHRVHGYRLPKKVLLALCLTTGDYQYKDGRVYGGKKLPDWRNILSSSEREIVQILFDNNYVMRRSDLEEKATKAGVNRGSFYVYIGYSPVMERYAPGVYGLRGAPITAAQIEALIPPILRKSRIFRDNGWTESDNLWIGYKVSSASSISGVLGVPASLAKFVGNSYRLFTETDEPVGTLTVRNSNMWGLSPFFRRWGIEAGDYIVIEFDAKLKIARIIAGDQEIISRYQDQENIYKEKFQMV